MDITLLKTFLELNRTRHFGKTARALFLTQSAVSFRLKQLEEHVGVKLFTRDRNNIQLTGAGNRFLRHAEGIVNAWHRAAQETALEDENRLLLAVGAAPSLWSVALGSWLKATRARFPQLTLNLDGNAASNLLQRLLDGTLDLAFVLDLPWMDTLQVEEWGALPLELVSTHEGLTAKQAVSLPDYIYMDWGAAFSAEHARTFATCPIPHLRINLLDLAMRQLALQGGSVYLPTNTIAELSRHTRVVQVVDAPRIECKVYAVHAIGSPRAAMIRETLAPLA